MYGALQIYQASRHVAPRSKANCAACARGYLLGTGATRRNEEGGRAISCQRCQHCDMPALDYTATRGGYLRRGNPQLLQGKPKSARRRLWKTCRIKLVVVARTRLPTVLLAACGDVAKQQFAKSLTRNRDSGNRNVATGHWPVACAGRLARGVICVHAQYHRTR